MEATLLVIFTIAVVVALLVWEYRNQDCINGKPCKAGSVNTQINPSASLDQNIGTVIGMVKTATNYTTWRLALIVALILSIPIAYLINGYFPTIKQWLIVAVFIFIGAYFSAGWLWSHWVQPSASNIERNLLLLSGKWASRT